MNLHDQLTTIEAELAALPALVEPGEFIRRHKAFIASGDRAGLAALSQANAAVRPRRQTLAHLQQALHGDVGAAQAPGFVEPVLAAMRAQAAHAKHTQPVGQTTPHRQPVTPAEQGEDGVQLLLQAGARRTAWQRRMQLGATTHQGDPIPQTPQGDAGMQLMVAAAAKSNARRRARA